MSETTTITPINTAPWEQYINAINGNLLYRQEDRETLLWSVDKARSEGWSMKRLSDEIGISHTVLQRVIMGTYKASADKPLVTVKRYRTLAEARESQGDLPEFIMTPIAKRVWHGANWALKRQRVVNLIGKTQRGKTFAIEEYARQHGKDVIIVRCPAVPSPTRLIRRIAWAMGSSGMINLDTAQDYIMSRLSTRHLLVIDEIHHVIKLDPRRGQQAVELLREIIDAAKCGTLLIGTEIWDEALYTNDAWVGVLSQMLGRGRTMRIKDTIPLNDLRQMWEHYSLPEPDDDHKALICSIANDRGLTYYTDSLRDGRKMSINRGVPYTWGIYDAAKAVSDKVELGGK